MTTLKRNLSLWWVCPDLTEARAAQRRAREQECAFAELLARLKTHRDQNHFAERIGLAYKEARR